MTLCKPEVKIKHPELNLTAHIFALFHITSQKSNYDVICDQDILREPGMHLDFPKNFVIWRETTIPMKIVKCEPPLQFKKVKILRVQLIELGKF